MAGDLEGAISKWLEAHRVTPSLHEPYLALGDLYFRNGQYDEAGDCVEKLMQRMEDVQDRPTAPDKEFRASVELLYGAILLVKGQSGKGVERWRRAMELDPNFALANATFIGKALWPGLVEAAQSGARTEDQRKAARLVGSLVSEDTAPQPACSPAPREDEAQKKGGFPWFSREKKK